MRPQFSLEQILQITNGKALGSFENQFSSIGTDSRKNLSHQLFLALAGDQFDGHQFCAQAAQQGATGFLVHNITPEIETLAQTHTVIVVSDTLNALHALAQFWKQQMKAQIVTISGSNGKTTTKEFAAQICQTQKQTSFSPGSFNNHWGLPFSLLKLKPEDEIGILELGMNHKGELKQLCQLAEPNIVLITNVGRAHIGELGSQQAIAEAKEELYDNAPEHARFIFNLDNEYTIEMHQHALNAKRGQPYLTFSSYNTKADVQLKAESTSLKGLHLKGHIGGETHEVTVPIFGRHNTSNIMAAACIALACGLTAEQIWAAIPKLKSSWGRNQIVPLEKGVAIFDAYNANPDSMAALNKNIYEIHTQGHKYAILGEMLELGDQAGPLHEQLGETLATSDLSTVYFFGPHHLDFQRGFKAWGQEKTLIVSDVYEESLALKIKSMLNDQDVVILKGSRGMKLERALKALSPIDFE